MFKETTRKRPSTPEGTEETLYRSLSPQESSGVKSQTWLGASCGGWDVPDISLS